MYSGHTTKRQQDERDFISFIVPLEAQFTGIADEGEPAFILKQIHRSYIFLDLTRLNSYWPTERTSSS